MTISPDIVSTSYRSRLHNVKTKRDKRTAKKSVKVQAVLEDDTLNNKPIHFGVYKIITRLLDLERSSSSQFWSCHHMQHYTVSILHPFATHNKRLLYQINHKLITDCHPTYCDQNTAKNINCSHN